MAILRFKSFMCAMILCIQTLNVQSLHPDCKISGTVYNCSGVSLNSLSFDDQIPVNITAIDLSYNHLTVVPQFPEMTLLEYLNLSHNSIENLTDNVFSKIGGSLKDLDLSSNNIDGNGLNDNTFSGLEVVTSVVLSKNPLKFLPNNAFDFNYLNDINQLDLSFCEINSISVNTFTGIKNMKLLNLSNNEIEHFSKDIFKGLHTLEILDLSNNKIKSLNNSHFIHLDSMETILLNNNLIASIDRETFKYLIELDKVYLRHNKLQHFPFLAVSQTKDWGLSFLDLSNNPIKSIAQPSLPNDTYINVETLRLEYMHQLETIRGYAFSNFTKLKKVYITHNHRLFIINKTAFSMEESELSEVYLNDNSLVTMSKTLLPWGMLDEISIANNVWNCDCHLLWVLNETTNFTAEMRCSSPESVRGKYLKDLSRRDLRCLKTNQKYGHPYVAMFLTVLLAVIILLSVAITVLFFCLKKKIRSKGKPHGKYVMVYTQDADEAYLQEATPNDKTPLNDSVDV